MPLRSSGLQAFRAGFPQHRDVQDRLSNKVVAPTDPVSNSLGWNSNTDAMFRKHSADDRFCPDNGMVANRRALQNGYFFTEQDVIADRDICGRVYPESAGIVDNRMHVADCHGGPRTKQTSHPYIDSSALVREKGGSAIEAHTP